MVEYPMFKNERDNMKIKDIEKQLIQVVKLGVITSKNLNTLALKVVKLEGKINGKNEIEALEKKNEEIEKQPELPF